MWNSILESFLEFLAGSGFYDLTVNFLGGGWKNVIMIVISFVLLYLAIKKEYEPLLLLPIAFGMFLVNLPLNGLMAAPTILENGEHIPGGLMYYLYQGNKLGIFPPIIFMGVGVLTDFGPLLANPKSFLLGAAAQFGIFLAFFGAIILGQWQPELFPFDGPASAAIAIIGGADGPTAIYTAIMLAPNLLGPIAVAAYSYMSLVPIIQPPIMRLLTTEKERKIKMVQLRVVSQTEKILFPIIVTLLVILIIPATAPLVGMLMFGNLIKVSGVTEKLADTASNALMYIITIFLGITVGATTNAEAFLNMTTLAILALGLLAFCFGTASGVILGKIMCKLSGGKINPLIGAAGVSAVPMAARVVHKVGREEDPSNFLLMHAMGPNVAGVIGSAVAAGIFLSMYS